MRWLLIQAALSIMRLRDPRAAGLRTWALRIAGRRGRTVAAVALARRLAGILWAMLRDDATYDPQRWAAPAAPPAPIPA
jgi:transposase